MLVCCSLSPPYLATNVPLDSTVFHNRLHRVVVRCKTLCFQEDAVWLCFLALQPHLLPSTA